MSRLHRTSFSPLDHGTTKRIPLWLDIIKSIGLLPLLAFHAVRWLVRECWRDAVSLATGNRRKT